MAATLTVHCSARNASRYWGNVVQSHGTESANTEGGMSSTYAKTALSPARCSARNGANESEQLPMSTVVTPCCGIGSHVGSQNSVGSKWVCESMKPGATVAPPASSSRSPAGARSGPISLMTPAATRTSARRAGAPVPSTTLATP